MRPRCYANFCSSLAKYFMAPLLLNVTKERSLACGSPNGPTLYNSSDSVACLVHAVDVSSGKFLMSYSEQKLANYENDMLSPNASALTS